jgi:hypothetical protein
MFFGKRRLGEPLFSRFWGKVVWEKVIWGTVDWGKDVVPNFFILSFYENQIY